VVRNDVGVDDRSAPGGEHIGNLALSRPNATCQTDLVHAAIPRQKRDCTTGTCASQSPAASERNGPKANAACRSAYPRWNSINKTPDAQAISSMEGRGAQPVHAPIAASSFMSPPPIPGRPRQHRKTASVLHNSP